MNADAQLDEFLGRLGVTANGEDAFVATCQPAWPGRVFVGQLALFSTSTAFAGQGHGLAHGIFHNSDGDVAAVAVQNALMRRA